MGSTTGDLVGITLWAQQQHLRAQSCVLHLGHLGLGCCWVPTIRGGRCSPVLYTWAQGSLQLAGGGPAHVHRNTQAAEHLASPRTLRCPWL